MLVWVDGSMEGILTYPVTLTSHTNSYILENNEIKACFFFFKRKSKKKKKHTRVPIRKINN